MNTLHDRLESLPPGAFPFASEFLKLRDVIAPQISDTRILFPEFTPHDEPLHVVKLFQLADKFFGQRTYRELNAPELFLLGAGLYAHDWGMAVGEDEKHFLRNSADQKLLRSTFVPLPDEHERLEAFLRTNGLMQPNTSPQQLTDHYLRQYVRETHARRSGSRVRAHFKEYPAMGEALARICEGHWYDFATLDNPERFPREYEVAGNCANLLALALQVRIIDLFHITDDRTPFALWRFVSPTDAKSAEEWKKHRALHGVAVTDFSPGRAIKVQGFTENEEVWAGLQDLRKYCQEQISCALDVSARHVPNRYGLDFLKLEWAVTTGELRPVDFRFEFDRSAMFRILSNEIYDGDCHVFLRELLQNAIDAIRTRRARSLDRSKGGLKRKLNSPTFDTTIYFTVQHQKNGNVIIVCRDFGIGMDEHVIRNYFTVAGVSYYRSSEFERQHLGFEPISRFGIGVLSCFMGADKVSVKTYRDPESGPPMAHADFHLPSSEEYRARRLSLEIPAIDRQFIVKELCEEFAVGTEIRLEVLSHKLQSNKNFKNSLRNADVTKALEAADSDRPLKVTEYLTKIAGFVEFPIHVEEWMPDSDQPTVTLILHPERDPEAEKAQYDGDIRVHQLSRDYPWESVTKQASLDAVRESMGQREFDLSKFAEKSGYEGWIVFPKPAHEEWDFSHVEGEDDIGSNSVFWFERRTRHRPCCEIQWDRSKEAADKENGLNPLLKVYRDGILLDGIVEVQLPSSHYFPKPMIIVNLPSNSNESTNVARTKLSDAGVRWDKPIWKGVEDSLGEEIAASLTLPLKERIFRIGWLAGVFGLSEKAIARFFPDSKLVTVWLLPGSTLELQEGALSVSGKVPLVPEKLNAVVRRLVLRDVCDVTAPQHVGIQWEGERSLVMDFGTPLSGPIQAAVRFMRSRVSQLLHVESVRFLEPPNMVGALLRQFVSVVGESQYTPPEQPDEIDDRAEEAKRKARLREPAVSHAVENALSHPEEFCPKDRRLLADVLVTPQGETNPIYPISFSAPFETAWVTNDGQLNLLHVFGQTVLRCLAVCAKAERDDVISKRQMGGLRAEFADKVHKDMIAEMNGFLKGGKLNPELGKLRMREFVDLLFDKVREHNLIAGFCRPEFPPEDEQVPVLKDATKQPVNYMQLSFFAFSRAREYDPAASGMRCGKLITKWPIGDTAPPSQIGE